MFSKLAQAAKEFIADDCPTLAAALAYYTVFSLPPLLFIVIVVAGYVVGRETVEAAIQQQVQSWAGGAASGQVQTMSSSAAQTTSGGWLGLAISAAGLIFGATTAFAQLQAALNRSWKVTARSGGVLGFIFKRLLSFAIVLLIAALILAAVVLNSWTASAGELFGAPSWLVGIASFAVSFLLLFALFAVIFKFFPDTHVEWSDVKVGALLTAALFEVGRFLLSLYLGTTATASMYGAAGSLAIILLFVYYSSMLVLFGAEFTQVWAKSRIGGSPLAVPATSESDEPHREPVGVGRVASSRKLAVFGLYGDEPALTSGLESLRAAGFRSTDISVLFANNQGRTDLAHEKSTKAPEGAAAGTTAGLAVGGTLGWLAGLGALAIPGAGPFLVAGPIFAALAGAGAGGAVGGLLGALVGLGVPEFEAKRFDGRIRKGSILISVHCEDGNSVALAKRVLNETGAEDVASAREAKADAPARD